MGLDQLHHVRQRAEEVDHTAEAQRATGVSVTVNLPMAIAQVNVGWLASSQS
jgi:divalent metal cation (Fe/Co/Zn/Cd) transporter